MTQQQASQPTSARYGTIVGGIAAVVAGLLTALLGTMLHGQILYLGDTPVTWGAVAALVLATAFFTLAATYSERLWAAALAGTLAYGVVALISFDSVNWLIVPWSNREHMFGPALAGSLWTFGLVAATIVALFLSAAALRRRR
ncbi:hypothetical protein [Zhihengliuella halotolerans]|uniref:hypothetical protein n=1 Tax=Zhihengliuella halotolerans TaxID=370736 RepID=UPI000C7FE17D|nr:hypothetical protein [Zhihengliuella halotolerans]